MQTCWNASARRSRCSASSRCWRCASHSRCSGGGARGRLVLTDTLSLVAAGRYADSVCRLRRAGSCAVTSAPQPRLLLIDNYDSFTYNLVQRLGEIDPTLDIQVFRNNQITVDELLEII